MGIFNNNNLTLLDEQPFFYASMNPCSADNIEKLSNEVQMIKYALLARFPQLDLSSIIPIDERIISQYSDKIADKSTLLQIFRTNEGYCKFKVPVVKIGEKVAVNLKARIFTEDIPFGLCILQDIAEMLNVEVPNITRSIEWHQVLMNKQFVVNGKLNEAEIQNTGCPRRFGFRTIEAYVSNYMN